MSDVLLHIAEKLERADKHVGELHRECETFLNATPHRELVNYDTQVERYERQIRGITRTHVRTLIDDLQPYALGDKRDLHWLAILKKLNDSDKHRALRLQTVVVQPRIKRTEVFLDGDFHAETDYIDDGTQQTSGYTAADGEWVDVVNVQRRLTTFLVFAEWPGIPKEDIEVAQGLWAFWRGVTRVVKEFSRFL